MKQQIGGAGLFGAINETGTIQNLTISGKINGVRHVGGICGYIKGKIVNCINECDIYSLGDGDRSYTGGIAGYVDESSEITGCTNSGKVTGKGAYVGGVLGYLNTNGNMTNCENSGTINGTTQLGGIVGNSIAGEISNCRNIGNVIGNTYVGRNS